MQHKDLPIETQFALRSFPAQVQELGEVETKRMLVKTYEQMLIHDTIYGRLIGEQWGFLKGTGNT